MIHVLPGGEAVTFMYSYPNRIPLPASAIHRIVAAIEPLEFERMYGCWPESVVPVQAKAMVMQAAERYLRENAT